MFSFHRFRRITTSTAYVPAIDGFRFLAIGWVVLFHSHGYFVKKLNLDYDSLPGTFLFRHGHWGVELFFVISGLVLGLTSARHHLSNGPPVRLDSYFLRRLTRLEPPYLLSLSAIALLIVLVNDVSLSSLVPHFLASATYCHGLLYHQLSAVNCVAWSLEVEVQFYLLAPCLATIFAAPKLVRRIILALAVVLGSLLVTYHQSWLLRFTILGNFQYFLAGFLLADLYVSRQRLATGVNAVTIDAAGVGLLIALPFVAGNESIAPLIIPWLAIALFYVGLCGRAVRRLFSHPVLALTGGMCYSIYLIHFQIISLVGKFVIPHLPTGSATGFHLCIWTAAIVPIILAGSAIFFRVIERPCMDPGWPQRLMSKLAFRGQVYSQPISIQDGR